MPPFWRPEPLFTGDTVFCLAGGPSLRDFDFASLAGKRVIAVNEAIKSYPAADILYFWDDTWFVRNQALVHYRAGLTVTGSRMAAQQCERLRYIELQADAPLEAGAQAVRKGRSSGHTAIALAVACGASRVVLLGYDMRTVDGRSHFHDAYSARDEARMAGEWIPAFKGWAKDAKKAGVAIVNATPGSALKEFPAVKVAAELQHGAVAAGRV